MPRARKNSQSRKVASEPPPPVPNADTPSHALIASRAYDLFVRRGGEHGHDWEDWLAAERELLPSAAESAISSMP